MDDHHFSYIRKLKRKALPYTGWPGEMQSLALGADLIDILFSKMPYIVVLG
jgi:hypothetical protein